MKTRQPDNWLISNAWLCRLSDCPIPTDYWQKRLNTWPCIRRPQPMPGLWRVHQNKVQSLCTKIQNSSLCLLHKNCYRSKSKNLSKKAAQPLRDMRGQLLNLQHLLSLMAQVAVTAPQKHPLHPCRHQCTWSRTLFWHHGACLPAAQHQSGAGRSCRMGDPQQSRHR